MATHKDAFGFRFSTGQREKMLALARVNQRDLSKEIRAAIDIYLDLNQVNIMKGRQLLNEDQEAVLAEQLPD